MHMSICCQCDYLPSLKYWFDCEHTLTCTFPKPKLSRCKQPINFYANFVCCFQIPVTGHQLYDGQRTKSFNCSLASSVESIHCHFNLQQVNVYHFVKICWLCLKIMEFWFVFNSWESKLFEIWCECSGDFQYLWIEHILKFCLSALWILLNQQWVVLFVITCLLILLWNVTVKRLAII